ncbi:hypothetical protein [Cohnella sp.]|uniref:hypothetical protein n=1 Tax=Cohnella sp. TaxID=1883426 RepID=UPI0035676B9E
MSKRTAIWTAAAVCCAAIVFIAAAVLFSGDDKDEGVSMAFVNAGLRADGVQLGMREQELVKLWGLGQYQEGFGGHFRLYPDRQCDIGIPGDSDNDLYGDVGQLEISNPQYGIFGINPGDAVAAAEETLHAQGFRPTEHDASIWASGEFTIMLRGQSEIDSIYVGFNDKDLRDRQY